MTDPAPDAPEIDERIRPDEVGLLTEVASSIFDTIACAAVEKEVGERDEEWKGAEKQDACVPRDEDTDLAVTALRLALAFVLVRRAVLESSS